MPLLTLLITSYHAPEHHTSDSHSPSSKPRRNFKIELKMEQSGDVLNGRYGLPTKGVAERGSRTKGRRGGVWPKAKKKIVTPPILMAEVVVDVPKGTSDGSPGVQDVF